MAAAKAGKSLKDSDEFATPLDVLTAADALAPIVWDLAATTDNGAYYRAVDGLCRTQRHFGKEHDALAQNWVALCAPYVGPVQLWLNPPFSKPNLQRFAEKTREEASRGATIGFLGPANTASRWFHDLFFRGGDVTGKYHIPRGALRGLVLELDFTRYTLRLHILEYRLAFGHPDMADPEQADKGHVYGLFRPKRLLSQAGRSFPARAPTPSPAEPPPDPSGEAGR